MPINFFVSAKPSGSQSDGASPDDVLLDEGTNYDYSYGQRKVSTPTTKANSAKALGIVAAAMVGRQTVNFLTSNVGKFTGNSQNQVAVNNAMEVIGIGILATQSWPIALATAGIKLGMTAINNWQEDHIDNIRVGQASARAGYRNYNDVKGNKH